MLKKGNWRKNSLTNQEPRSENRWKKTRCVVFDRSSIQKNTRFSSQSFPSDQVNCWRVLEDLSRMYPILFHIHPGFCVRLHFSIDCFDCRRTTRLRQCVRFSRIQILFADHVYRPSAVDSKFSCFKCKILRWRQAPIFWKWEDYCCFIFSSIFGHFWPSCNTGSFEQMYPSEGFWSRMWAWRFMDLVSLTCRIDFSTFEFYRKIDEYFGASIFWNTEPKCFVIFQDSHFAFFTIFFRIFAIMFILWSVVIKSPKSSDLGTTFSSAEVSLNSCCHSGNSCVLLCTSDSPFWFSASVDSRSDSFPKHFLRTCTSSGYWIFGVSFER